MNLRVNTCIDVGCIYGLTPAEKSNPIGRVDERKSNGKGKTRFWINVAQHTHVDASLVQPCLSKYRGEIKF